MSHSEHESAGRDRVARCAVVTCSDTRTPETDVSGNLIASLLEENGHEVVHRAWVTDDANPIRKAIADALEGGAQIVITTGGTGISRRDTTFEAIQRLILTEIPGFGELFRMLSWEEIGAAAMMSRATAGLIDGAVLFALPGSRNAVELAMTRLILPQVGHFLVERSK